ncbi:MAG: HlyD family efflux transporter periplasmic adaptor subunit [Myxococcales bacterium]|nr:HlyD family efflux transporter periplasmic adaptor subunit [Myxococcales bacterium]
MRPWLHDDGGDPLLRVRTPVLVERVARRLGIGLLLTLAAFLLVPWQQTSQGHGRVIAYAPTEREQTVGAPISGIVQEWKVQEGDAVKKGQVLARMADNAPAILERLRQERDAAQAEIQAAEAGIASVERQIASLTEARRLSLESADADIGAARQKVAAAKNELKAARAEERLARLNLERREKLREQGLRSQRDLELAQFKAAKTRTEVLKTKAKVQEAEAALLAKQADREQKGADADAKIAKESANLQKLRADRAKADAKLAKAEVKVSRQEAQVVIAPRAGIILRILANEGGEQVKSGAPLAILVPDTDARAAELWVSGNDAPLITPGRKVRLQFEGWPAVQFSGWPSVAVGTFGGQVAFVDYAANAKGKFRVVVQPDPAEPEWPQQRFLRQGARANGWVLLNEVTVGFELWRQLNGFPAVAPEDSPAAAMAKEAQKNAAKGDKGDDDDKDDK